MNVVKVLRACEKALLWNETVYLYKVRTFSPTLPCHAPTLCPLHYFTLSHYHASYCLLTPKNAQAAISTLEIPSICIS